MTMGFNEQNKENKTKIKICQDYAYFMYKTLEYCIMKIDRKSVDFYRQDFISFFIALAFIRLYDFSKTFEEIITKKGFADIEGWKSSHLTQEETMNNPFAHLFDWKTNFFDHLPHDGQLFNEIEKIKKNISMLSHWKTRLEKRGIALLLITEKYAGIVQNNTLLKSVSFYHVPGYELILRIILSEMKEREAAHYPDALIKATTKMLCNT